MRRAVKEVYPHIPKYMEQPASDQVDVRYESLGFEEVERDIEYCGRCGAWRPQAIWPKSPYLNAKSPPTGLMVLVYCTLAYMAVFAILALLDPGFLAWDPYRSGSNGSLFNLILMAAPIVIHIWWSRSYRQAMEQHRQWEVAHPGYLKCHACGHEWVERQEVPANPRGYTCEDAKRASAV